MILHDYFKTESIKQALFVLEREKACVLRQDTPECDRNCKACDLLLSAEAVVSGYDTALVVLNSVLAVRKDVNNDT